MNESSRRSIRILVDLQACQTPGSAHRGVGRYSKALFESMLALAKPRQVFGLLANEFGEDTMLERLPEQRIVRLPTLPAWDTGRDYCGGERDSIDALLLSAAANAVAPDVVHVSHVFEGFGERVPVPSAAARLPGQVLSATLYDLIPLRFDHYFRNREFARWYHNRLKFYHQADLLLSISESSRQDAISLLGLEPQKIVTIHGGISDHFRPVADRDAERLRLRKAYGLEASRIVLYTGGDEHRKNLDGAIQAYAQLPSSLRSGTQLVIVCAMEEARKQQYRAIAQTAGLAPNEACFLGFIPEPDLVAFYSVCDVFFFPSLYEGLGLPVLEAMASGAPVLSGDNSSLKELVGRKDALFNAEASTSIAERIVAVLGTAGFADELRLYGQERTKEFTWEKSARRALEAFDEALARKRAVGAQTVVGGWLPRPRLAMLTPLPPCRSGIADYNAAFLPYLSAHFDIDLYVDGYSISDERISAGLRVFDARDFGPNASSYDAILYEFGNSEFHAHMLPLLAEFPGIVGLHDAFLSGLIGYLELKLGESGRYAREMLHAHAGQARRLLAPVQARRDAIAAAMVELPCTKRVLDQAIGVISHSPFNLELAREFHPEGWWAPYRIIPQMIEVPEQWSEARTARVRSDLGFGPDDFVIATFGHVAWTKCGDRLLQAVLQSALAKDPNVHLVFAGELAKDDFGLALNDRIRESRLGKRIVITGFLPAAEYERYLRVADVAVQLRIKSRGGTPRSVLDCLAHRLPVLVNNEASFADYPDNVVMRLMPDPSPDEIAEALLSVRMDGERSRTIAEQGLAYVRAHHDPKLCAAQYAAAIHEFSAHNAARAPANYAKHLAPHLAAIPGRVGAARMAAQWLNARAAPQFTRSRLVIDVSHIAKSDHETGIPRVVKETVRAAYCSARPGVETLAVEREGDRISPANAWLEQQGLLLPHEIADAVNRAVEFRPGDHLLMLDSSWHAYDQFAPVFAAARTARAPITTAIYDLLPITLPPGNIVDGGKEWFEGWIRRAIAASDALVCISRSVADDTIRFINQQGLGRPGLKIGWWHLGSDLRPMAEPASRSPVRRDGLLPYALMVGTIEPRKNHQLALDAFERLWADGSDLKLVIVGKPGWLVDELLKRLRSHHQLNQKLFIFEQMSDPEIFYLYRHAAALLFLSKGEGFGLPLVEAAHHGTPIVCSDISSTREIAGEHATYVGTDDAAVLARDLNAVWQRLQLGTAPQSSSMPRLSWEESTNALMHVVIGQNWYWRY